MRHVAQIICDSSDDELEFILHSMPVKYISWPDESLLEITNRLMQRRDSNNVPLIYGDPSIFDIFANNDLEMKPLSPSFQLPEDYLDIENWPFEVDFLERDYSQEFPKYENNVDFISFITTSSHHPSSSRDKKMCRFISEFVFFNSDSDCLQTAVLLAVGKEFPFLSEIDKSGILTRIQDLPEKRLAYSVTIALLLTCVEGIPLGVMARKYKRELKRSFKDPLVLYSFLENLRKYQPFGSTENIKCLILLLTETGIFSPGSFYNYLYGKVLGEDIKVFNFAYRADWVDKMI